MRRFCLVAVLSLAAAACGSDPVEPGGGAEPGIVLGDDSDGSGAPAPGDPDAVSEDAAGEDAGVDSDPDVALDTIARPDAPTAPDIGGDGEPADASDDDASEDAITDPTVADGAEDVAPPDVARDVELDRGPLPDSGPGSLGTCCGPDCETRCDLSSEECCIRVGRDTSAACVPTGACDSGIAAACDGAEDCRAGASCCVTGTIDVFGGFSADLRAACAETCRYAVDWLAGTVSTRACHAGADCGDGERCCGSPGIPASLCLDGWAASGIEWAGATCAGR